MKRTLVFSSACRISLKNCQLNVENQDSGELTHIPIEDLAVVIIENQQVSISVPALNALAENNCAVVVCDSKHMPSSMLMNLDTNTIQGENYRLQTEASPSLKKKLWRQIVRKKIQNQSRLLTELGLDGDRLKPFYMSVKSGDVDNREGIAAKLYWDVLLGDEFIRSRFGGAPNGLLNYGYSILRAAMTRAIMGSGLFPAFGLFHKNRYNSFPLADDLMEPYRPFVDRIVYMLCADDKASLNTDTKQRLLRVLFTDTSFKDMVRPLEISLSVTTASLVRCLAKEEKELAYPQI